MTDLVNLLDARDRKTISLLATIFGCLIAALLVFGVRAGIHAGRAAKRLEGVERNFQIAERERAAAVGEWERWRQAETDLRELREGWFYDTADGVQSFRLDLRDVLERAGVAPDGLVYGDAALARNRLRMVSVGFRFLGSYAGLRRLLEAIEAHPRALIVEKINIQDAEAGPGLLEAQIALTGYSLHE